MISTITDLKCNSLFYRVFEKILKKRIELHLELNRVLTIKMDVGKVSLLKR